MHVCAAILSKLLKLHCYIKRIPSGLNNCSCRDKIIVISIAVDKPTCMHTPADLEKKSAELISFCIVLYHTEKTMR